jgi:hypothetical protein
MYTLTVLTMEGGRYTHGDSTGVDVYADVPYVGDLITMHPDGDPSLRSYTARVSGIQRVLRGSAHDGTTYCSHVAVTAVLDR